MSSVDAPKKRQKPGFIKSRMLYFWNFWPPFIGAGISIRKVEGGWGEGIRAMEIRLRLWPWNSNYVGTQFGGSLFAMTDPFLMVMLMRRLGRDYVVWDKAASIRYLRPGRTDCFAGFEVSEELVSALRTRAEREGKFDWTTKVDVRDSEGRVVAEVDKVIYIAKRSLYEKKPLRSE
ncbi:MAG: DUF4442 domain-containing protein [Bdellovibrionales bacterium]|nr:DUF4442 domain-containing protein [Bdellovibrionales bacterium]